MTTEKEKEEQRQAYLLSRRNFLSLGAGLAGSMGLLNVMTRNNIGYAASPSELPKVDHLAKKIGYKDGWLGTTRIVGPIPRISELDTGFNRAALGKYGPDYQREVTRFVTKVPHGKALVMTMQDAIAPEHVVDGPPNPAKLPIPDPERMSTHIKEFARFLGADACGIGLLPEFAIYTEQAPLRTEMSKMIAEKKPVTGRPVNLNHKYVIAVLVDQDLKTMLASTGYDGISIAQSFKSYLMSGVIACVLAAYIRDLGWSARAHHARNYQVSLPPTLIAAGLGEMSRTGESIAHPTLGFRHKGAVITTDIPLAPDSPIDFGLADFCRTCKKCAEHCPAQAITHDRDQKEYRGYMKWVNDLDKCTMFRVGNTDGSSCGRCMKVCPWNTKEDSWFHTAGVWAASKSGAASTLLRDIDDMFGYGTEVVDKYRWWLEWPELYKWGK